MRRPLLCVLVVAALLAPTGLAGTRTDPEIVDAAGDAEIQGSNAASLDIRRAWFGETSERLEVHVALTGYNDTDNLGAIARDAAWTVAFTEDGVPWRLVASHEGAELGAQARRDGTGVEDANVTARIDNATVVLAWHDHVDHLPAGARLASTYAHTRVDNVTGANDAACHGETVVDCAPDEGTGDAFVLAGDRPETTVAGVHVAADREAHTARPGDRATFDLAIENPTSEAAEVDLGATAPTSWEPTFDRDEVTVEAGGTANVSLALAVPDDAAPGHVPFSVVVDVGDASGRLDLAVDVRSASAGDALHVEPAERSVAVEAGDRHAWEVVVENRADRDLNLSLALSGARPAWVALPTDRVELAPGETRTIRATVDVPASADAGVYTHRLTFAGEDADVRRTADLRTTVERPADVQGGVTVPFLGQVPIVAVAAVLAVVFVGGVALGRSSKG